MSENIQITLDELQDILLKEDSATPVRTENGFSLHNPHSYRGFYDEIAFEETTNETINSTVGGLLEVVNKSINETFEGYKGGEYYMGSGTPVWLADEGCASDKYLAGAEMQEGILVLLEGFSE